MNDMMKKLEELDAKRTQGRWYAWLDNTRLQYSVVDETMTGWDSVIADGTLVDLDEDAHGNLTESDIEFIAGAPEMMKLLRHQAKVINQIKQAVTTADGWEDGETFYKSAIQDIREALAQLDEGV